MIEPNNVITFRRDTDIRKSCSKLGHQFIEHLKGLSFEDLRSEAYRVRDQYEQSIEKGELICAEIDRRIAELDEDE